MNDPGSYFRAVVKNQNFMTPYLMGYREIPNGVAEITTGRGFEREKIYGVTVVRNGKHEHENSSMFHSMREVERYISAGCRKGE